MTPIERAARALCEMAGNPPGATMDGKPLWMDYLPEVRAVISAIREPDLSGFQKAMESENVVAWGDYREFWIAMIDAMLEEG